MFGPYIYKIKYYDEVKETNKIAAGVTFAHKWSEAMKYIEDFYGNTLISVESLDEFEEDYLLELPVEVAEGLVNGTL